MSPNISAFLQKWKGSAGNERANKDAFLLDLCEALGIAPPGPKDQSAHYCFEKDLKITHLDGSTSTGSIDLFKESCFVLEAKQGSAKGRSGLKEAFRLHSVNSVSSTPPRKQRSCASFTTIWTAPCWRLTAGRIFYLLSPFIAVHRWLKPFFFGAFAGGGSEEPSHSLIYKCRKRKISQR